MGGNSSSNGGGEGPANKYQKPPATKKKPADWNPEKDDTAAKLDLFYNQGATNIKNLAAKTPGPALATLSKPLQAGSKMTREFFTNKVLTSERGMKNLGYTKDEFSRLNRTKQEEVYKGYLSGRQSGGTDAYGNPMGGGNDNKPSMIKKNIGGKIVSVTPTAAEVSQSEAANTTSEEDSILLRKKKTKAKGRSQTILTASKGVTTDEGLTLGKKSLLGS